MKHNTLLIATIIIFNNNLSYADKTISVNSGTFLEDKKSAQELVEHKLYARTLQYCGHDRFVIKKETRWCNENRKRFICFENAAVSCNKKNANKMLLSIQ